MLSGDLNPDGVATLLSHVFRVLSPFDWLILSGPSPALDERGLERLLQILEPDRPGILVSSGKPIRGDVEGWLEDISLALEITFTHVNVSTIDSQKLLSDLAAAGTLILVSDDLDKSSADFERTLAPALESVLQTSSLALWFVGSAVLPLGEWFYDPSHKTCIPGTGWLPGCLMVQDTGELGEIEPIQEILQTHDQSYALNLVEGATLALGSSGEIDLWGTPAPGIILGQGWGAG